MSDPTAFYNFGEYLRRNDKRYGPIPNTRNKPIVTPSLIAIGSYGARAANVNGSPCASHAGSYMYNREKPLG